MAGTLAAAGVATAGVATAVEASSSREALARAAVGLVARSYRDFVVAAATQPAPFDWSTDGCSRTPSALARRFAGACRQHDFAYRNLGHGLGLRADEATRRWVDGRFLAEMRRRCAELFAGLRRQACRATARAMWAAVRRFGPRWRSVPIGRIAAGERRRCRTRGSATLG